jgi:hypothetical protein
MLTAANLVPINLKKVKKFHGKRGDYFRKKGGQKYFTA